MGMSENNNKQNNQAIRVEISKDNMSAKICVARPADEQTVYTVSDIKKALNDAGVKMGIEDECINQMLENRQFGVFIQVAVGKMVEHGEDGRYELFFDYNVDGKPRVSENGSVDYFNIKLFEVVSKGDKLAEYIPPTKGAFGYDVKGKLLVPKPGRPKASLRGKGFEVSEDGNIYYAAIDGKVEYRNTDLNVYDIIQIDGDADMTVGNIDFSGDVNISGNVISGITIKAKGNVFIGGFVEGAVIYSEKDVVLSNGVNGKGAAKIVANGNVNARFIENTYVYADGDINADNILNSTIIARGRVILNGKKGAIHGGDVTGMQGVEAVNIGNESYLPTTVRVGATKSLKQQYSDTVTKLREIIAELDTYNMALSKYERVKAARPDSFDRVGYTKLVQSKILKTSERAKCEEKGKLLFGIINDAARAEVKVNKTLYPGSNIYIDGMSYKPEDNMSHLIVKKIDEKIAVRDFYDED